MSTFFLRSWNRASLMYSFKYTNKMQTYTVFFITVTAVRVSGVFSAHHKELKTVNTAPGIQGGSNMTGTDLYVNKPHCAAAVRP